MERYYDGRLGRKEMPEPRTNALKVSFVVGDSPAACRSGRSSHLAPQPLPGRPAA